DRLGRLPGVGAGMGEINRLQARINDRLNTARVEGSLTNFEFRSLKSDMARFEAMKQNMLASGGILSSGERDRLLNKLQTINAQATQQMNDNEVAGRSRHWWY